MSDAPSVTRSFVTLCTTPPRHPIGAVRTIGRYGSMLGLIVVFVLAAFANRVAEMTWVLFTGYRFGWGPT